MKSGLILAFVLFQCTYMGASAQESINFSIKGHLAQPSTARKIYLVYPGERDYVLDSSNLNSGNFSFTGSTFREMHATLLLDHQNVGLIALAENPVSDNLGLYLENHKIIISARDSLVSATVSGGRLNEENNRLAGLLKPKTLEFRNLVARAQTLMHAGDTAQQSALMTSYKRIKASMRAVVLDFVRQNPRSVVSLDQVMSNFNPEEEPLASDTAYKILSAGLRESPSGRAFGDKIHSNLLLANGAIAPEFSLPDTSGKMVSLKSFRGKYVLLDFWASWCGPCRMENPHVVQAFKKFGSRNFTVLGVSLDRPGGKSEWMKAIHQDGLLWTQVSDLRFWQSKAAELYNIRSIPSNILLNPRGEIIGKNLRGSELMGRLAEALK